MEIKNIKDEIKSFSESLDLMNRVYEDYSKMVGLPYTSMQILNLINEIESCSQKFICDVTFLPKQTVNTIVSNFYKDGILELKENPTNRRSKMIYLTEYGKEFTNKIIPKIRNAEIRAMKRLTAEQRKAFIEGMKLYTETLNEIMKEDKERTNK